MQGICTGPQFKNVETDCSATAEKDQLQTIQRSVVFRQHRLFTHFDFCLGEIAELKIYYVFIPAFIFVFKVLWGDTSCEFALCRKQERAENWPLWCNINSVDLCFSYIELGVWMWDETIMIQPWGLNIERNF